MFLNSMAEINQFTKQAKDEYYVDKSGLIEKMNALVGTARQFICITRPRRFGKSVNAMMLANYYAKNLDTKELFDKLSISKSPSYLDHLNKHNVIFISFNTQANKFKKYDEYISYFEEGLKKDLKDACENLTDDMFLTDMLEYVYKKTRQGFIFIIDEWDYIFNNELYTKDDRRNFLRFLEGMLKDKSYVELAYMTGINIQVVLVLIILMNTT